MAGLVVALGLTAFNHHISAQWHQQRWHFDELTPLEKVRTFTVDGAFYYNLFQDIVTAPDDTTAVTRLWRHDRVQRPDTVNALRQFSISTELALGLAWRHFGTALADDPPTFYVNALLLFNSLIVLFIFFLTYNMTGSVPAALIACLYYIIHRLEDSRVVAMPNLRENVALVWLVAQLGAVVHVINRPKRSTVWQGALVIATMLHVLTWQFGQFTMLLEAAVLVLLYSFGALPLARFRRVFIAYGAAIVLASALHFGNIALMTSTWMLLSMAVLLGFRGVQSSGRPPIKATLLRLLATVALVTVGRLFVDRVLGFGATSHVFRFARDRVFGGGDFDTLLYLCHPAFAPISGAQMTYFAQSLLLVSAALGVVAVGVPVMRRRAVRPGTLLVVVFGVAMLGLAVLANRFLVLAGTMTCVVAAIPFSTANRAAVWAALQLDTRQRRLAHIASGALLCLLVAVGAWVGVPRVNLYLHIPHPQQTDPALAEMTAWVKLHTPKDAVFAADMGLSASIRLLSDRRTLIHPHYEDVALRMRVRQVYQIYGHKSLPEVHQILRTLGAEYLIVDFAGCLRRRTTAECRMSVIADAGSPSAPPNTPTFCASIPPRSPWFREIYANRVGRIFEVVALAP